MAEVGTSVQVQAQEQVPAQAQAQVPAQAQAQVPVPAAVGRRPPLQARPRSGAPR
jgi:hypothetical protein